MCIDKGNILIFYDIIIFCKYFAALTSTNSSLVHILIYYFFNIYRNCISYSLKNK